MSSVLPGFGADPAAYRFEVIFVRLPLTAATAMRNVPVDEGVDRAYTGSRVLYFSRLTSSASQSYVSHIVSMPMCRRMTIRNWNTTTKPLDLLDGMGGP